MYLRIVFVVRCLGLLAVFYSAFLTPSMTSGSVQAQSADAAGAIRDAFKQAFPRSFDANRLPLLIPKLLQKYDLNDDGVDDNELVLGAQAQIALLRGQQLGMLLIHDLDGDGSLTAEELVTSIKLNRRTLASRDERQLKRVVDKLMAMDPNEDGRITPSEYSSLKLTELNKRRYRKPEANIHLMKLLKAGDPNDDGLLTPQEALSLAKQAFSG